MAHISHKLSYQGGASVRIIEPNDEKTFKTAYRIGDKSADLTEDAALQIYNRDGNLIDRTTARELHRQPLLLETLSFRRV
ncbi:MAG: hypothetical protein M3Q44_05900 [bacterium]|nr:hypothetical protein [bacterium]